MRGRFRGVQRRDGHARGACGRVGNAEQGRDAAKTVCSARKFLGAGSGSRAASGIGTPRAVGGGEWAARLCGSDAGGRGKSSDHEVEADITMSRTVQDVLEFDKLRELLRLRTTCAPGRRAVNDLEPRMDRAALKLVFALIREAAEWLRAGRELGFGALVDPQGWLERIEGRSEERRVGKECRSRWSPYH